MIRRGTDLSPAGLDRFDSILDVRSPGEFAADHLPGAISMPVLDDRERAEVGTIYTRRSHFEARRLGAALVAANVARHLQTTLAGRDAAFRPLVYCWRGGMRSAAVATIFEQIGWQTTVLEGGYRSWRRRVVAALYNGPPLRQRLVLLAGATGVGKTATLAALAAAGEQTLDLEALAGHRGSLFGATPGGQPTQKRFESAILAGLERLDPERPLFAEAESSRIGALTLPPALWTAMTAAPRLMLEAGEGQRLRHILCRYRSIVADREALLLAIDRLPGPHGRKRIEEWRQLALAGDFEALARALVREHYDPAYARSRRSGSGTVLGTVQGSGDFGRDAAAIRAIVLTAAGPPAAGR